MRLDTYTPEREEMIAAYSKKDAELTFQIYKELERIRQGEITRKRKRLKSMRIIGRPAAVRQEPD